MGGRRADTGRGSAKLWWASLVALAVLVTSGVVAYVLGSDRPSTPAASPAASPTPSPQRSVGLSHLPIPRARFCDWIGDSAVRRALGGPISQQVNYNSGDRVEVVPGVKDVAHEYDCTFDGVKGGQARAWVFAPPVDQTGARRLVRLARAQAGCTPLSGGPRYGDPTVSTDCTTRLGDVPVRQVTLSGLFTDAWFSCQVSVPHGTAAATRRTAEQWCVHVATTLGARP
jgi:hypothetical protein